MHCNPKTFIAIFFIFVPLSSLSKDVTPVDKLSCFAKHLDTDQLVEVKTVSALPSKKIATAQWPLGYPTIAIDESAYAKLPKNAKQFVYYHECAHLTLKTEDEYSTDCESINSLVEKHGYSEIDIRKLIQSLTKKLGWSKRWEKLISCKNLPE